MPNARRTPSRGKPATTDDSRTKTSSNTHRPFARDTPPHRWLEGCCGRSPGSRFITSRPPSRIDSSGTGWRNAPDYSCGGSSGIQVDNLVPNSLLIPVRGTFNGSKSNRPALNMSSNKPLHIVTNINTTTKYSGYRVPADNRTATSDNSWLTGRQVGREPDWQHPPCCARLLRFQASNGSSDRSPD